VFRKTLVCLDGSKLAEEILPYVANTCSTLGTEVVLLHVYTSRITIPPPQTIHAYTFGRDFKPARTHTNDIGNTTTLEPQAGAQLKEIAREQENARKYMEELARPLRASGLKTRVVLLEGTPEEAILKYAESNNVSLIAITTHGSSGLKKGMFGRVARAVMKDTTLPVLLIKPHG